MLASCALILYDFRAKNPTAVTKFPVHLRVIFKRFPKTYSLRFSLTRTEFKHLVNAKSVRPEFQLAYHFLNKASDIILDLKEEFSFEEFENRFFSKSASNGPVDLIEALEEYGESALKEGRIKTFQGFRTTLSHVRVFHKKKRLPMSQVTPIWLKAFDDSLRSQGMRTSSIGIHVRNIRTVFNWEISKGRVKQEYYPFGRNRYVPPASTRVKKALTYDEVLKIFNYVPTSTAESWSRDMWLFSYLGNGMNIKDLALLRFENIVGEEIHFIRAKTLRKTMENQRLVHVHVHPHMKVIIRRWGKNTPDPKAFIFDIMDNGDFSPLQEYRNVNQAVKTINKYMKRIGEKLQLSKLPTCNFARHTYSTVLKRANVPIEVISEALGHFSVKTTEIYLDSFESDKRAEISKHLLPVGVENEIRK
jgi:integrase/recombinase XerD